MGESRPSLKLTLPEHIGTFEHLKFEVLGDARMDEQLDQNAVGHQKFWYQIDIPVARTAVVFHWHALQTELLEEILEWRDRGGLTAVVRVAIDVQHFLATHRQHAGQDALLQTGAQNDSVVFFIHFNCARERVSSIEYNQDAIRMQSIV